MHVEVVDIFGIEQVSDSSEIIAYLDKRHGITLDKSLSAPDRALAVAWDRRFCEHLYWSGVIEPGWRLDEGWEVYTPYVVCMID